MTNRPFAVDAKLDVRLLVQAPKIAEAGSCSSQAQLAPESSTPPAFLVPPAGNQTNKKVPVFF
jgi:hypothetical protein